MSLQVLETIPSLRAARQAAPGPVALVPTMGALHAGHRSLVRAARQRAATVIATLFVNPTQFAPGEDLARYPRTFEADLDLLRQEHVDLLFTPVASHIYLPGATVTVDPGPLGDRLDGIARPGHFRGVATIVLKLFHIATPDLAFFGQKDAAQLAVLRALVRDLDLPIELEACPTVRDPDGLALSSRNRYLSPAERAQALALPQALAAAAAHAASPSATPASLRAILTECLAASPQLTPEYADLVDPDTLLPAASLTRPTLLAAAVRIGTTRLIDNIPLPAQVQP